MNRGWQYRIVTLLGTAILTVLAVVITNLRAVHDAFAHVPYFGRPAPEVLASGEVGFAVLTTLALVLASMWPLFKPRPRRILDTLLLTQKRVILAMLGLAALGYFNYTYRLPRTTLMLTTLFLFVTLPLFTIAVRRRPRGNSRAIIVGDDPKAMESLLEATGHSVLGYVSPPSAYAQEDIEANQIIADGRGETSRLDSLPCLGGLARLDEVILDHDIDTVLLAFEHTDREEFFGVLETCHEHGLAALVHQAHAEHVLTDDFTGGALLRVDLEPLDWQDHVIKRAFDVAFASVALLLLSPVIIVIMLAIKLDDGGDILYHQERTASFGSTFTIYKFRSMTPEDERTAPDEDESYRVTRVGRVLRRTHLDEIPQLWSILTGKMSVVGPRAVWTDEEAHLEDEALRWRKRWFIKPGLTGLAQIRDATSTDAEAKLRYDLEYIRRQSFWFDLKIVVRQLWQVGADAVGYALGRDTVDDSEPAMSRTAENRAGRDSNPVDESSPSSPSQDRLED